MAKIIPVIMCGGSGTRLWPMSRAESPKQFQRIDTRYETTFFQATVQRHSGELFGSPVALVNEQHVGLVKRQLATIQRSAEIVIEPCSRNTAPALAVAALQALETNPDSILLTLPSDHQLSNHFNAVVAGALEAAEEGYIVTFGIKPTYPETGYGYITDGGSLNGFKTVHRVAKFTEKPAIEIATALIGEAMSYWASGIALFRPQSLLAEYAKHAPDILDAARDALALATRDKNQIFLHAGAYGSSRNISCESAVLEKSDRIVLAPADVEWDDLGAWPAFHRLGEKSAENNVISGDVLLVNTTNSYIRSEEKLVTVIGLSNIVVVDTADALLIADMDQTQAVKMAVTHLAGNSRREVLRHKLAIEEWGTSNTLASGTHFALRQITIGSGCTTTLGGSERVCIVSAVEGTGQASAEGEMALMEPGKTLEFDAGTLVIVLNTGSKDLHVIEMQVDAFSSLRSGQPSAFAVGRKQLETQATAGE